ncbi:MAG TPA: hypothetical protein VNB64_10650 [Solirubrobacteraceae bacterium]|nr:hypothetical protein [Solirubrobacteraceae bacterium]
MYDTLLFLHVLTAFMLGTAAVMSSAIVLAGQWTSRTRWVADRMEDAGATGTLVLGIWLALYVDGYALTDGWILGAIVLWALAATCTLLARPGFVDGGVTGRAKVVHWTRTALVVAILVLMVWKPGA